jgi:hypothetical protein
MLADFEDVLDRLNVASRNGQKAMCFCPAHDDRNNPSLSLKAENGKLLLYCFAGCPPEDILSKIGLGMKDLFSEGGGGSSIPQCTPARLHATGENPHSNGQNERATDDARPKHGCTLKEYSEEKKLPEEFLRGLGLRDVTYLDKSAASPILTRRAKRWQFASESPWRVLRSSSGEAATSLVSMGSGSWKRHTVPVTWSW